MVMIAGSSSCLNETIILWYDDSAGSDSSGTGGLHIAGFEGVQDSRGLAHGALDGLTPETHTGASPFADRSPRRPVPASPRPDHSRHCEPAPPACRLPSAPPPCPAVWPGRPCRQRPQG